jgi:hypothetical protein
VHCRLQVLMTPVDVTFHWALGSKVVCRVIKAANEDWGANDGQCLDVVELSAEF